LPDPLVSVLVPVFNAERFIAEALDSIWAQQYDTVEVLVIDDGSSDGSVDLVTAECRAHPRLRLLGHSENRGPGSARNTGLAAARGELITFLDADDLMTRDRLSFQVDYLARHREVDVVVGTEAIRVSPGVELPGWLRLRRQPRPRYYQMSMMVRRSAFDRVGPFDESFRMGSDHEWMCRAETANVRTALVDRVLLVRRIHGANLTYHTEGMRRGMERALLKSARDRILRRSDAS
jgi:glycosyltransferase involved in cell wall biosynthesis